MSKRTPNNAITEYPQYDGMYYDRCEGIQRKTHGNYRYKINKQYKEKRKQYLYTIEKEQEQNPALS